ncbi:MAG: SH3 domain-containing protein [Candidatus Promineifilaceae bacterium]|jgi:uncharacterized protein YraI
MLNLKSQSTRYAGLISAGLLVVVLALFIFAPTANAAEVPAQSSCNWLGNYWNNTDLSGQPTLVRCDEAIDFDWHGLSPDVSINVDNFSARWVRVYNFAPGSYRFQATMDDGMQVYIDNQLIINSWQEGNVRTIEADVNLSAGQHQIVVNYFEKGGNAVAGFTWYALNTPVNPTPQPPIIRPPSQPSLPSNPNVEYPVAEVKASYLNVRSGAGVQFPVIGVLHRNTKVFLMAREMSGRWVLINTGDGLQGWVNRYYLYTTFPYTSLPFAGVSGGQPQPPTQPQPPSQPQYDAYINTGALNVRSGPGVQYRAIAVVQGGQGVYIVNRDANGWVQIQIPGSVTGWVNGYYLSAP